jgi:hypothetical protein
MISSEDWRHSIALNVFSIHDFYDGEYYCIPYSCFYIVVVSLVENFFFVLHVHVLEGLSILCTSEGSINICT